MNRVLSFFTCLFILVMYFPINAQAGDVPDPKPAAAAILDEIIFWESDSFPFSNEIAENPYISTIFSEAAPALLERVSYVIGGSKITGNTAVVDVALTVPYFQPVVERLITDSLFCAAISRLSDNPLNVSGFLSERANALLSPDSLITIRMDTSLYLILDAKGQWTLDCSDIRNLGFLEAMSAGTLNLSDLILR